MKTIRQRFHGILFDTLGCHPSTIQDAMTLELLGADSLDEVEIVIHCDAEFQTDITDDDTAKLTTIGDWIAYMEAHGS